MGIGTAEGLLGIKIGNGTGPLGSISLQGMGQHIESTVRNEPFGQLGKQLTVQDGRIRPECRVYQRVLDLVVGQDGKVCHL